MFGKSVPLSLNRKFLIDLFWIARRAPVSVIGGTINLADLIAARRAAADKIPYTALFAKALAIAADRFPELRRNYIRYPLPHLFETFDTSVSIMVERDFGGEKAVVPILVKNPRSKPLAGIAWEIRSGKSDPPQSVRSVRRILQITRWPLPIRRLIWLAGYHSGRQRSNYFGSFAISSLGAQGKLITFPLSPVTTCLTYGGFSETGDLELRIGFDHRVYDGALVARTMAELETILNGEIAAELRGG